MTNGGLPCIYALSLLTLSPEWIPIANSFESHLVRALVQDRRSFVKTLRYNLQPDSDLPSALLTDTDEVMKMFIDVDADNRQYKNNAAERSITLVDCRWTWRPQRESFPAMPPKSSRSRFPSTTVTGL